MEILSRSERIAEFRRRSFDLLVVGGGIVGAGIARDAALRGLSVALVEQGDFASGTSSKTSKLIHGGLRYLEQGDLPLVFESLRERRILSRAAPGRVRPIPILIPVHRGESRPPWKIRTGLALYKLLSGGAQVGPHRWLSAGEALAIEPGLARTGLVGGGLYADCQMDDARHCLENILQAGEAGAVCLNYLRVENFLKAAGRLCGAVVQDRLTGRLLEISSKAVISAVGPWGDQIRKLAGESGPERLAPTKGIHLVLPRRIHHGLFIEARRDRRMLFLLPWGMVMLAGTTESAVSGDPGALHAAADEVGYLLEEINRALPEVHFSESDVITTFAGARPLLRFSGLANAASRSHRIEEGAGGLISVMGGKYTTYRRMAAETVDFLVRRFRLPAEPGATGRRPLIPAWDDRALERRRAAAARLSPEQLAELTTLYGAGAGELLDLIEADPTLADPAAAGHRLLGAQLVHGMRAEGACTVTDLLVRRSLLAFRPNPGLDLLPKLKVWMGRHLGLAPETVERQWAEYLKFLERGTAFRRN